MTFQGVWSFLLFLDTFRIQGILLFLLFLYTFEKVGRLYYKGMKAGRFKGFCHFPCFQTLPPSRASQARGEACVTVGPPTNRQCNLQSIVYRLQSCLGTAKKPSLVHFCLCGELTCCNFLITDRSNLLFDITQQFGVHSVWAHNLIMYTKHNTYDTEK